MSDIRGALNSFSQTYGRPALLAILLHAVLLAALLQTEFTQLAKPAVSEPIVSYLYQPPQPVAVEQPPQPLTEKATAVEVVQPVTAEAASSAAVTEPPAEVAEQMKPDQQQRSAESIADTTARPEPGVNRQSPAAPQQSLAQRALNRAATVNPAAIEQAATASYQQLLQARQQPKTTVEKRHQELSDDPAQQVVAQLGEGIQLVRTKGGCRIADPTKDGFDALMAARAVPCGDEEKTSDLLKQALEKHRKR